MHDPYFAFSTGVDAWDSRVVQYGFSNNDFPEKDLPDSTIFIWDAHFSANEGRLSLEKIIQNANFEIVKVFEPEIPFKVLGGNDFRIIIFRKTSVPQFNDISFLDKLTGDEFNAGIYYHEEMNFEHPFSDQQMENRRVRSSAESQNFMIDLKGAEFSPAFVIPAERIKSGVHNKIRLILDICRLDPCGPNRLFMVLSAEKDGHSYHYVTSDVCQQIRDKNLWSKTDFVFEIPEVLKKNSIIKIYIWNIEKCGILMDNFKLEISEQN